MTSTRGLLAVVAGVLVVNCALVLDSPQYRARRTSDGAVGDASGDVAVDAPPDADDDDYDRDRIRNADDGTRDSDGDGIANERDTDSDGDGIEDRVEAGDDDLATPPVECPNELDRTVLRLGVVRLDGIPDFRDNDSDNDGLTDGEERAAGTNACNPDSDADGQLDSLETAWCQRNGRTGCATDPAIRIPDNEVWLLTPDGGPEQRDEVEFVLTTLRQLDVFFLFDTTGSMHFVEQAVARVMADPVRGIVAQLVAIIPDATVGVGHYDDFPVSPFGAGADRALHPLCDGPPMVGSARPECRETSPSTYGGIIQTESARAGDVQRAALAIGGGLGSDGPESQVEALYQTVTNEGLVLAGMTDACRTPGSSPCWIRPTTCPEGRWGYSCFRRSSLSLVVHLTDVAFHNGARDVAPPSTGFYAPYAGIRPEPHTFDQMAAAYVREGTRIISVNGSVARCEAFAGTARGPSYSPCYDFAQLSEATGSIDVGGVPLVYDLPATAPTGDAIATIVSRAVARVVNAVPLDASTLLANHPMNPAGVDATRFVTVRTPSCQIPPTNDMCWTAPSGVAHSMAVARTDSSHFYRTLRGTRIRFTVGARNAGVVMGEPDRLAVVRAVLTLRPTDATETLNFVVPARANPDGG